MKRVFIPLKTTRNTTEKAVTFLIAQKLRTNSLRFLCVLCVSAVLLIENCTKPQRRRERRGGTEKNTYGLTILVGLISVGMNSRSTKSFMLMGFWRMPAFSAMSCIRCNSSSVGVNIR